MKEQTTSQKEKPPALLRLVRIWSGVVIGLGILIFIAEILEGQPAELAPYPWYEDLIPLALFTSLLGLALAWKWQRLGATIMLISVIISNLVYSITGGEERLIVFVIHLPVLIPAILFLICWWRDKRYPATGSLQTV